MRFKGTLTLLIVCLGLGAFLYFYEIKGGEKREKAKLAESQVWKLEGSTIRRMEITSSDRHITLVRQGESDWGISEPRPLEADSGEVNRLVNSASDMRHDAVVEENAKNLAEFGLDPPRSTLKIKTKDGKEFGILFGHNNPSGSFAYAMRQGRKEVFLINNSTADAFDKKLDDLRNHSVLSFDKAEVKDISIKSSKGDIELSKDSDDRWWLTGKERVAADSPGIRGILNSLSLARIKEFYVEPADGRGKADIDHPLADVSLVCGKNRTIKHLIIGPEKSEVAGTKGKKDGSEKLYLAKDESRSDLFYVDKELVDKLVQSHKDLREKALAAFQRWEIDSIHLANQKGTFTLNKSNGEWFVGNTKKKAKWDAVNGILDGLEKKTKELLENPASLSTYGLDEPSVRAVLKQGNNVVIDCALGKAAGNGFYAKVKGDPAVKIADPESFNKLNISEADVVEPPAPPKK